LARPLLEDGVAVGFVIGIVKDGQTQVIAYGETTKASGIAPTGDSVFEIGSISKVFTGVLLANMVQGGSMKLGDPVQQYLPASVQVPVADGAPITLEHLATHTSGLPRLPDNFTPTDASNPYADYTVAQMYAFLSGHKLRRPPGQYEYSNYAMGLLGHLLARQAGKTYEQLLIEQIGAPLGMHDTRIVLDENLRQRLAPPYNATLQPVKNWDLPTLSGAGGIRSTCHDLIKFIKANLARDEQPLTQALRLAHRTRHTMTDGLAIGLGWHIARDGVTRWHNGMTWASSCCPTPPRCASPRSANRSRALRLASRSNPRSRARWSMSPPPCSRPTRGPMCSGHSSS
jgi:CubicO group peptidase (beta-lactamase class C family)